MTDQREIFDRMMAGNKPYEGVLDLGLRAVITGWPNQRDDTLIKYAKQSTTIVEVGSFLGRSAIVMAKANPDALIWCVDTWLGSPEIPLDPDTVVRYGRKNYYERFLTNMIAAGISDRVFPICQTSTSAAVLLKRWGVVADMIYVDAAHSYHECYSDLIHYSYILSHWGVVVGDDFDAGFPGVVAAAQRFAFEGNMRLTASGDGKYVLDQAEGRQAIWPGIRMYRAERMIASQPAGVEIPP